MSGLLLIRGAHLYDPEDKGIQDVLIGGGKILKIGESLPVPAAYEIEIIEGNGKVLFPGLIDCHVHILGGGGEGGYRTRTPEIMLTDVLEGGVTTVAGCLGTDGTTRTMSNLIAKAKGLEEEGISTYIYTGSYQVPVRTLLSGIQEDLILLDKVIGTGEIALSDHRSSQPTYEEFARIVADTRVGGILSGKAGLVNIHMGDGKEQLAYLRRILTETQIPASNMLPTHINRNRSLFADGVAYARDLGGFIDLTTSTDPNFPDPEEVKASTGFRMALEAGAAPEQITFSSDGQGSLPVFDKEGNFLHLGVGKTASVYREMRDAFLVEGLPLSVALKPVTSNPAALLKLPMKGRIAEHADADLVLSASDTLEIDTVIAKGVCMISGQEVLKRGTFEYK